MKSHFTRATACGMVQRNDISGRVRRKSWTQKLFAHEAPNRRVPVNTLLIYLGQRVKTLHFRAYYDILLSS